MTLYFIPSTNNEYIYHLKNFESSEACILTRTYQIGPYTMLMHKIDKASFYNTQPEEEVYLPHQWFGVIKDNQFLPLVRGIHFLTKAKRTKEDFFQENKNANSVNFKVPDFTILEVIETMKEPHENQYFNNQEELLEYVEKVITDTEEQFDYSEKVTNPRYGYTNRYKGWLTFDFPIDKHPEFIKVILAYGKSIDLTDSILYAANHFEFITKFDDVTDDSFNQGLLDRLFNYLDYWRKNKSYTSFPMVINACQVLLKIYELHSNKPLPENELSKIIKLSKNDDGTKTANYIKNLTETIFEILSHRDKKHIVKFTKTENFLPENVERITKVQFNEFNLF